MSLLLGLAVLVAPVVPIPDEVVRDPETFLPVRKFHPLPGRVVGVLAGDVVAATALDRRSGPPEALGFSREGSSYRWVYVPARGEPRIRDLSLPVGEKGDRRVVFPALDMATPATVKPLGVTRPYALVEVEVNNGAGAPAGEGFVATSIKTLDGSKDSPLKVAEAVEAARKAYQAHLVEQQKEIAVGMEASRKAALGERRPTGPRETTEVIHLTWLRDKERLRVAFRTTIRDGAFETGPDPAADRRPPPPGGPAPGPAPAQARWGTAYGIELGRAYEFSKYGDLVKTSTLPVRPFRQEIPRPPAAK